jgi:hypothetical protein
MSPGLKGQNIVDGRKTCIHQQGQEAGCSKAAPNVALVEVRVLKLDFGRREGGSELCIEVSCSHSLEGSDLNLVKGKNLQQGIAK